MIVFEDVAYDYGSGGDRALDGVSLSIRPGERVALVGANGSGKSTFGMLCDGLLVPTRGTVSVDSIPTSTEDGRSSVRELVGIVFQDPDDQIVGTVVEEDVAFGPENLGIPRDELRRRVDEALAAVGLTGLERREPHLLSGGQKQRVAIAGVLALRPRYLILDEPTAMLDAPARRAVMGILERSVAEGAAVVHVTHDVAEASAADRVVALSRGRVVYDGSPAGLLGDEPLLARLGLRLPPFSRMVSRLRALGADVPAATRDAEQVVGALWP